MNGSGVLKVYLVESKKYAHRLKFQRAKPPAWVVDSLNSIQPDAAIGFEEEDYITEVDVSAGRSILAPAESFPAQDPGVTSLENESDEGEGGGTLFQLR